MVLSLTMAKDGLRLRKAHLSDLDDITTVAQKAFPDDAEFDYRFPYRHQYPDDNRKWIRREYEEYLNQSSKYAVWVVTAQAAYGDEIVKQRPVALAVWDIDVLAPHKGGNLGIDTRRDVNRAHFKAFERGLDDAFDRFFRSYGAEQYHLWLLATHPDFRRRGAGGWLCKWGMHHAAEQGYIASVFGSEMGTNLYLHLDWQLVGSFDIQADGEEEKLPTWALKWENKGSLPSRIPAITG